MNDLKYSTQEEEPKVPVHEPGNPDPRVPNDDPKPVPQAPPNPLDPYPVSDPVPDTEPIPRPIESKTLFPDDVEFSGLVN